MKDKEKDTNQISNLLKSLESNENIKQNVDLTYSSESIEKKINKYDEIHSKACENKEETYEDPDTGYSVFTKYAHLKRGKCCGSRCRHCPYNHINVKKNIDF